MRCPSCGARNTTSAAWCTQCYTPLGAADPPGGEVAASTGATEAVGLEEPPTPAAAERDIRVRGEEVEWRCTACDAWSPLEAPACTVCGAPRRGFGSEASPTAPVSRADPTTALVVSVLLPGLGHVLRGRVGTGLARAVLWLLWGGGGLAVLLGSGGGAAAAVLLLAALLVWAVTLVDLQRLSVGRPPLATGRVLAWSVVGVTIVLALLAFVAASGASTPAAVGGYIGAGPAPADLSR